ncbi:hypothetical protein DAPPUDRAFT_314996 [Daphnia pulex]|uniref:Uncharacterized protein n=1 Tax=Daphnia pulex TaxID=6669 RepID=E9G8C9_DAPPU|nr:hypothetical protein DAPPUDRAFT_314996 [Daphnia pulex]|eukprot:EFX83954.1 hypothetical protein DAPPUDRAFT_314996 [Daphnia pulex]
MTHRLTVKMPMCPDHIAARSEAWMALIGFDASPVLQEDCKCAESGSKSLITPASMSQWQVEPFKYSVTVDTSALEESSDETTTAGQPPDEMLA